MARFLLALCISVLLSATSSLAQERKVLVMGDSLMAVHKIKGRSVGQYLERYLKTEVEDNSKLGAWMIYRLPLTGSLGFSIPRQYQPGHWDWVVLNGGGNDLWLGCGCSKSCKGKLDRLISADGKRGEIPKLLSAIHNNGSRVIYVGYLRSPGIDTPIEACKPWGDALEARIDLFSQQSGRLNYLSLQGLVPEGDASYFANDLVHPATKSSQEIARRIAEIIVRTERQ